MHLLSRTSLADARAQKTRGRFFAACADALRADQLAARQRRAARLTHVRIDACMAEHSRDYLLHVLKGRMSARQLTRRRVHLPSQTQQEQQRS